PALGQVLRQPDSPRAGMAGHAVPAAHHPRARPRDVRRGDRLAREGHARPRARRRPPRRRDQGSEFRAVSMDATMMQALARVETRFAELERLLSEPDVARDPKKLRDLSRERSRLSKTVETAGEFRRLQN